MSISCLGNMRFRRSFTCSYPGHELMDITPSCCNSLDGWEPLQLAAIFSGIHPQYNVQVGCCSFHFDLKLAMYYTGLPTSFSYHLALFSQTSTCWLYEHLTKVQVDQNWAECGALHPKCDLLRHTNNTDTSLCTTNLPMKPLKI